MNYKVMFAFCLAISMVACTSAVPKAPRTQAPPTVDQPAPDPTPQPVPEPKPVKNLFVKAAMVKKATEETQKKLASDVRWVRQCPDGTTVPLTQVVSEEPYVGVVARGKDLWTTWEVGGAGDYAIVAMQDGVVTAAEPLGDIMMPDQEIHGQAHVIYNICDNESGPWADNLNPGDTISVDSDKLASDVHWVVECEGVLYPHVQVTSLTPYASTPAVGSNLVAWWKAEGVTQLKVQAVRGGMAYYVSAIDGTFVTDQQAEHDGVTLIPQSCN